MPSIKKLARQFDHELERLFDARVHGLRSTIWAAPGAAPAITKEKIRKSIGRLQDLAEAALLRTKRSRRVLRGFDYKRQWHAKKGKGFGRPAKKRSFKRWYEQEITTRNCVYVFWNSKSCLYVGRTLNGKGRPSSHFEKHWFGKATRVDVFAFDRKKDVPRFECMMTHRFKPSYSRMKPSSKRYHSRCPICEARTEIKSDVKSLFRLR
jgi:hypothetical protein